MALEMFPTDQRDRPAEMSPVSSLPPNDAFASQEFAAARWSAEREPANYRLVRDFVDELPHAQDGVFPAEDTATAAQLQGNTLWVPQMVEDAGRYTEATVPYYLIGQRDSGGKQTQLLLAQPRHENAPSRRHYPDSRRLHIATALAKQWQVVQRAGAAFAYGQRKELHTAADTVVSGQNAVMRTQAPSAGLPWIGSRPQTIVRSGMHVQMRLLGNGRSAEEYLPEAEFDGFAVAAHLGRLASDFGKTVELEELQRIYNV